jgi:hypothetical protein
MINGPLFMGLIPVELIYLCDRRKMKQNIPVLCIVMIGSIFDALLL